MGEIIDGKTVAREVRAEVRDEVELFRKAGGVTPGLATVLVGDDRASATYVRNKRRACEEVGIASFPRELAGDVTEGEVLALVRELNERPDVHGILVQLPLPPQVRSDRVIDAVHPDKDVDGLHPVNQARLVMGRPGLYPCTPRGILRLIDSTGVSIEGKRAVVVGRSSLVGKPAALLLLERNATVTTCHSRTVNLAAEVARAEILVAAVGRLRHIHGEHIAPGAVVIDVGTNPTPDGKLRGDVDFDSARERAAFITPVPGGVGPMTIAMLMDNTLTAARRQMAASR